MVAFTRAVSLIALVAAASATTLYANKGCVIANDQKLCNSQNSVQVSGPTDILACIETIDGADYANCEFNAEIPSNYDEAFFGEDNCVYSAGSNRWMCPPNFQKSDPKNL